MLRRKMMDRLLDWRNDERRKVFILLGARQTGKTFIVREFAQTHYESFVEVNFLEDAENGAFLAGATSADALIGRLSLILGHAIEPGTLIFFDEVQQLGHDIVTLSKFLLDDGRFDVILSGSLLGTMLEGVTSFPVGYARIERMFPLDFEEYCWAMGVPEAILDEIRRGYRLKEPLDQGLHERLIALYRQYIVVGGMPEAVQKFLDHKRDLGEARSVGTTIVEQYRYDIIKYAQKRKMQIVAIFDNLAKQLAKPNKRFVLKEIQKGATFSGYENDFLWLVNAGVVLPAYLVSDPKSPLVRTESGSRFKLYDSDCGVLLSQYPISSSRGIVSGSGDGNYGAVYENVIAQELASAGFPLLYYNNNRKGEVDFLIENDAGAVIPLEVKSGKDYKIHSALNNLLSSGEYSIPCAYVLSESNVSRGTKSGKPVFYLPLYMTLCLGEERGDASGMVLGEVSFADWG